MKKNIKLQRVVILGTRITFALTFLGVLFLGTFGCWIFSMNHYLINSLQGIRFNVYKGLNVSGQVQWNYDNDPAEGSKKSDSVVFMTIGYNYEN